jgi:hypothetical protein
MRELLVVPCNHTFIMQNSKVIARTAAFLKSGRFYEMMKDEKPSDSISDSKTNQGSK